MSIPSTGISREDRKVGSLPNDLKPLTVTVKIGRKITGLGNTKFYELINKGIIKTKKIGKRRLVIYASLEQLAEPE